MKCDSYSSTAPSEPGPPHCRGFVITHSHSTLGRTLLDEWSARYRDLYLPTHNSQNRHPLLRRDSNPQSQKAAADPRLRPHGHWDRLLKVYVTKYIFLGPSHIRRSYYYSNTRSSAAARFLGLWVRIPPLAWISFSCVECWVLSGRGLCDGRSLVQRSPTECGGSECDLETSTIRRPRPP